jgi:membrane protease YdiL (CAAX protease family)
MTIVPLRHLADHPRLIVATCWAILLLVTAAEFVTAVVHPHSGLILHTAILLALLALAATSRNESMRKLALALVLAPLIRLLSLSLPLPSFPQIQWYPIVSVPLMITLWLIARQGEVSTDALGLRSGRLPLQLMIMCGGLGLGAIEYAILAPEPLIRPFSWPALLSAALTLTVFTGFTEEIIFRGLLQSLAIPVLGRWALIYVALLFGVLHIGYLSVTDVVFVFAVGMLFAYIVYWSNSILGVTLAHGLTNVFLFLVMPHVAEQTAAVRAIVMWAVVIGSLLALAAVGALMWQAWRDGRLLLLTQARRAGAARPARASRVPRRQPAGAVAEPPAASAQPPRPALLSELLAGAGALWHDPSVAPPAERREQIYRQLTGDTSAPLLGIHVAANAPAAVSALLFVPAGNAGAAAKQRPAGKIDLYVNGELAQSLSGRLLPAHFRFISGIVHVGAAPGERQATPRWGARRAAEPSVDMRLIGRELSRRLTRELSALADDRPAEFRAFWAEYGAFFEVGSDAFDRRRSRWLSSASLGAGAAA